MRPSQKMRPDSAARQMSSGARRARPSNHDSPISPSIRRAYVPPRPEQVHLLTAEQLLHGTRPIVAASQQLDLAEIALQAPLWCVGDLSLIERRSVAIVGARHVTTEGAARARRLARELSEANVTVVSGLAKGVDTAALTAAVDAGGKVIAVVGTPVDRAYPAENKALQEQIYRDHLLVSQFAPGVRVFPRHFPQRNRLMALLTDASVIVEAGETSGTLHQATECVRLGRWLFIARSVVDDSALTWPARFTHYPNVRVLAHTQDLLGVLR